ncbi:rho GTPase-activating protein 9 [Chelonoidis abingdonii]|uniref:rho GTPase-activating protein 9 n=1 Tax=Chelonoidis abingdonii TaxID=106734 RepID=UPI003F4928A0
MLSVSTPPPARKEVQLSEQHLGEPPRLSRAVQAAGTENKTEGWSCRPPPWQHPGGAWSPAFFFQMTVLGRGWAGLVAHTERPATLPLAEMLSGRWRLEGRSWRRAGPSSGSSAVALRALYDYQYEAEDGRQVAIEEGERFLLLHKSNEDWWQVRRLSDPRRARPIFVPATYVAEVAPQVQDGPWLSATLLAATGTGQHPSPGLQPRYRSLQDLSSPPAQPAEPGHHSCHSLSLPAWDPGPQLGPAHPVSRSISATGLAQSPGRDALAPRWQQERCPELVGQGVSPPGVPPPGATMEEPPIYCNLEEIKRVRGEPPNPCGSPLQVLDTWERHLDPSTGRSYFYNPETGDKSWKPPRRHREMSLLPVEALSPEDSAAADLGETLAQGGGSVRAARLSYTKSMILPESRVPKVRCPQGTGSLQEMGLIRGLDVDGIYRVSGNLAVIQKLRFAVDRERAVTSDGRYVFPEQPCQEERLSLADPEWDDVHVVTGALKLFFRELPEPLVPFALFDAFVAAVKLPTYDERVQRLAELVQSLPPPNYATLRYILAHLRKVMEYADANRMTRQNIGIVFGPTLLRPEKELASMAVDMVHQNQAVELLLAEFQRIFPAPGAS